LTSGIEKRRNREIEKEEEQEESRHCSRD